MFTIGIFYHQPRRPLFWLLSTRVTPLVNEAMSSITQDLAHHNVMDTRLEGDMLNLVPDGDTILVVSRAHDRPNKRFLVSTSILSLASRYFDRLFNGDMAEAQKHSSGLSRSVDLNEDDPQAMEIILQVLHHQAPDPSINLDLSLIASVALHADKYDICTVMEPWVAHWLDIVKPTGESAIDIGLLLLTTHMVRAQSRFTLASKIAVGGLANGFEQPWSIHELLQHIPDATIGKSAPWDDMTDDVTNPYRPTFWASS